MPLAVIEDGFADLCISLRPKSHEVIASPLNFAVNCVASQIQRDGHKYYEVQHTNETN